MAEVMSMLSDENSQGELNADEQESLQIGEEMQQEQETMLAGKYKNAEELEAAYIELQKKLGSAKSEAKSDTEETEPETAEEEEETTDNSLFDRLWDESQSEFNQETLDELSSSKPEDLAKMYLEYRNNNKETKQEITKQDASDLIQSVGGESAYKEMLGWANENLNENEVGMYDAVMDSGDRNAAYFAMQALAYRYSETQGVDGNLLQGKAPNNASRGFKSQAEVVTAMQDPRYDKDPAYRQEVMAKLESSNVNF